MMDLNMTAGKKDLKISVLFIVVLTFILPGFAAAQEVINWKVLTSMRSVKGVVMDGERIWAGTEGGAFSFSITDSVYTTYTKNEQLSGSQITAITRDNYGKIWIGCLNGQIDVLERRTDNTVKVKSLRQIKEANFNKKQINAFSVSGDTILVSTDFGVCLIDSRDLNILDTYANFASAVTNNPVNYCIKAGKIFTALGDGIAVNKTNMSNLSVPEAWSYYAASSGYPLSGCVKLGAFMGDVIAATNAGIVKFTGTNWVLLISGLNFVVKDFYVSGDKLYLAGADGILYQYSGGTLTTIKNLKSYSPTRVTESSGTFYLATSKGILELKPDGNINNYFPDGPQDNQLYSINTDVNGNLWVATGRDNAGKGIFKYDGKRWKTFDVSGYPIMKFNDYVNIFGHPNGDVYAGSWGFGALQIKGDDIVARYDTTNTPMSGITGSTGFLVIGGMGVDSKRNLWFLDYWPADKKILHVQTTDGLWYSYSYLKNPAVQDYYSMVVDNNDTKWFISVNSGTQGLYYFNEMGTFSTASDDIYDYASRSSAISGKTINSVVVDRRGDLWVGTNLGVFVCTQTQAVLVKDTLPTFSPIFSLRQYAINDIAVDGINRKWVATNQGLILVSSDGQSVLASYNTGNSPLISDDIKKLAMDIKNGILYIGMDGAIVAARTLASQPYSDLSALMIYPNPVKLSEGSTINFEGLVKDSEINIITTSCKLVKHIITPGGGKAIWDGRDEDGHLLASGIYFAVVYDKEGSVLKSAKLAVIRK